MGFLTDGPLPAPWFVARFVAVLVPPLLLDVVVLPLFDSAMVMPRDVGVSAAGQGFNAAAAEGFAP
jgi:hypothetical protein